MSNWLALVVRKVTFLYLELTTLSNLVPVFLKIRISFSIYTTVSAKIQHNYLSFYSSDKEPSKTMPFTGTYLLPDFNGNKCIPKYLMEMFDVLDLSPFSEIVLQIFSSRQWFVFSLFKYCLWISRNFLF